MLEAKQMKLDLMIVHSSDIFERQLWMKRELFLEEEKDTKILPLTTKITSVMVKGDELHPSLVQRLIGIKRMEIIRKELVEVFLLAAKILLASIIRL